MTELLKYGSEKFASLCIWVNREIKASIGGGEVGRKGKV